MDPIKHLLLVLSTIPPCMNEHTLHTRVGTRLDAWKKEYPGADWAAEVIADRANRIDFVASIDGLEIGIECKTRAGTGLVKRQLYRYADFYRHLILLTCWPLEIEAGEISNAEREPVRLDVVELWKNNR